MTPEEERSTRDIERQRILAELIAFLDDGGGSFRKWLDHLGMDYVAAYKEGWMGFTNALAEHETRITNDPPFPARELATAHPPEPSMDPQTPELMFDWCKECTCYRQCYWRHDGSLSSTPNCLDPDCADGPER